MLIKESIFKRLSESELTFLSKLLDQGARRQLNGNALEIQREILRKTGAANLQELLSLMHLDLIEVSEDNATIQSSINHFLSDPRLTRLQSFTEQAVRILNNATGQYIYINHYNEMLSGIPNEKFMKEGLRYSNFRTHPWDLLQLILNTRKVMVHFQKLSTEEKLNTKFTFDLRYRHPKYGYMRVQQHALPISIAQDGKPLFTMVISNDISQIKESKKMNYSLSVFRGNHFEKIMEGKTAAEGNLLSEREIEILTLISDGMGSKEIAMQLFISQETVKTHYKNMIAKTGANNITEVVKMALVEGWI